MKSKFRTRSDGLTKIDKEIGMPVKNRRSSKGERMKI
jgi:hypothetical protein